MIGTNLKKSEYEIWQQNQIYEHYQFTALHTNFHN